MFLARLIIYAARSRLGIHLPLRDFVQYYVQYYVRLRRLHPCLRYKIVINSIYYI